MNTFTKLTIQVVSITTGYIIGMMVLPMLWNNLVN